VRRLLLIDDNEPTRKLLTALLQANGWRVTQAASGDAAVRLAEAMQPQVVLCDLQTMDDLKAEAAALAEKKTYGLTPRELEVVQCIVEGCTNKDIAGQFKISEETVKRHLSNTFDKTGVSTRLELALFAISHKLAEPL